MSTMRLRNSQQHEQGFALITVMVMVGVLAALITAYFTITMNETSSQRSQAALNTGFNAAEGGLNLRAMALRSIFQGYNSPSGTPPVDCQSANSADHGSGDYACTTYSIGKRTATTYMTDNPNNPVAITIPGGELYAGLNAQEYTYNIYSEAGLDTSKPEAIVMLRTKVRLVPLFQFAAFYNKDLEVLPGADMTLSGPIHVNGDLYVQSGSSSKLAIAGQTTVTGKLYHGRKDADSCDGKVTITDAGGTPVYTPYSSASSSCTGSRKEITTSDLPAWGGNVQLGVDAVQVPPPEDLDPVPGAAYWDRADLRLVLKLNGGGHFMGFEIRNADDSLNAAATNDLTSYCGSAVDYSSQTSSPHGLYNPREGKWITMLDVNLRSLLTCAQAHYTTILDGRQIDDTTEGGLVFHFSVDGPNSNTINNYGIRLRNAARLASTNGTDPAIKGLTVVTNQALYVQGDYNSIGKKPAGFLADSFNVLSNNWSDADSYDNSSSWNHRIASSTTINAAVMSGTDSTGNAEGTSGQDSGAYNGGLENYPRFLEQWSGRTLTYRGSFVSLDLPRHVNGAWHYGNPQYTAPNRDFGYDTDFNNAANLPPLSPRFVYLRQEIFDRTYAR
jgi:Tfp pilus assembly protein PilE